MWCSSCQQDVPAIASPENRKVRCYRCRADLMVSAPAGRTRGSAPSQPTATAPTAPEAEQSKSAPLAQSPSAPRPVPPPAFWDLPPFDAKEWQCEEELHLVERQIRSWSQLAADKAQPNDHDLRPEQPNEAVAEATSPSATVRLARQPPRDSLVAWALVTLGVMSSVFGGALVGWSIWSGQTELWRIGLPFAVGGQIALVMGLLGHLDSLSLGNVHTAEIVTDLDEQPLVPIRLTTPHRHEPGKPAATSLAYHWADHHAGNDRGRRAG